jgi:membrane-bound lytic murein transglycosylase D
MLNPELSRWCTPPYMKTYRVKLPSSSKESFLANYNSDSFDRRVVFATYKVKNGDTVTRVARKFATQPEPIRELNNMGTRQDGLRGGRDITLPIPTGYKRVIASLYDEKPSKERRRRVRRRSRRTTASVDLHGPSSGVRKHGRLPTRLSRD